MTRPLFFAAAVLAPIAIAFTTLAQTDALPAILKPIVVTIDQSVPLTLTVAVADGLTTTVPLTLDVDLAITLHGDQLVDLAAGASNTAVTLDASSTPATPVSTPVDNNGIPYSIEAPDGFAIEHLNSSEDYEGNFVILGEIANNSGRDAELVKIALSVYDAAGALIDADYTYPELDILQPGQSSAFEDSLDVLLADVGRYKLQVQP